MSYSTTTPKPRQLSEFDCHHFGAHEGRTWPLACNSALFACCARCKRAAAIRFGRRYLCETREEDERRRYAVQAAEYELTRMPTNGELADIRLGK